MTTYLLAIESSCDETSAAIINEKKQILSNVIKSQIDTHSAYGGVVPEIASRLHYEYVDQIVKEALEVAKIKITDLSAVCVTKGPGLIGPLLIGICTAKAIAYALQKPLIGINHLEGHLFSPFEGENVKNLKFPFLGLIISGGHTSLYLVEEYFQYKKIAATLDDAVGEAFDKVSILLGLGYPGGPQIDRMARLETKEPDIVYTKPLSKGKTLDFSFSGLKTQIYLTLKNLEKKGTPITQDLKIAIAKSFQKTAIEVVIEKTLQAASDHNISRIVVSGGVAQNSFLREKLRAYEDSFEFYFPSPLLCADNAGMIGLIGMEYFKRNQFSHYSINAEPFLQL